MERRRLRRRHPALRARLRPLLRSLRPQRPARPHHHPDRAKPDFFFLWIYAVLAYLPPELETPFLFIAPVVVIGGMLLLPLVAGEGEKHWSRRPVAVLMVSVIAVALAVFTHLATYTPWSPIMNAWSGESTPPQYLKGRSPLERQGAVVLQNKQCRNCHELGGAGGQRGPALDGIANRMTEDQMIRQVLQGGGNMPAYGNALNPAENPRPSSLSCSPCAMAARPPPLTLHARSPAPRRPSSQPARLPRRLTRSCFITCFVSGHDDRGPQRQVLAAGVSFSRAEKRPKK